MDLTKYWAATLEDYVIDLAWSADGTALAAAAGTGPVSILSATDGAKRHLLPGHDDGTNCLAWLGGGATTLVTGGQDGAVKFWDASAGQHTATAKLGSAWVEHLAARPVARESTGKLFVACAAGRNLHAVAADGSVVKTFPAAPKTIAALAFDPGGGSFAAAYFGGVDLWDADDFTVQKHFVYNNGINALAWSPDGKWLVSGNQDPSVHLWIPEQDVELHMSGYEGKVKHLSFDHTSRWLATSGGRDTCVWDCSGEGPEGREPLMFPHEAPICAVAFQNSHSLLASGSSDGSVQLWSPDRKQPLRASVKMPVAPTKLAWSPDDRLLAIGAANGAVYVLKSEG